MMGLQHRHEIVQTGLFETAFSPGELIRLYRDNWETPAWNIRYEGPGDGAAWLI